MMILQLMKWQIDYTHYSEDMVTAKPESPFVALRNPQLLELVLQGGFHE